MGSELRHLLTIPSKYDGEQLANDVVNWKSAGAATRKSAKAKKLAGLTLRWLKDFSPWGGMGVWPRVTVALIECLQILQDEANNPRLLEAWSEHPDRTLTEMISFAKKMAGSISIAGDGSLHQLLPSAFDESDFRWVWRAGQLTLHRMESHPPWEAGWLLVQVHVCRRLAEWSDSVAESDMDLTEVIRRRIWRSLRPSKKQIRIASFGGHKIAHDDIDLIDPYHGVPSCTFAELPIDEKLESAVRFGREALHLVGLGVGKAILSKASDGARQAYDLACLGITSNQPIELFAPHWISKLQLAREQGIYWDECCFQLAVAAVATTVADHEEAIRRAVEAVPNWDKCTSEVQDCMLDWSLGDLRASIA